MKIDHLTIDEVSCFENSRGNGVIISWTADIGHGELTLYQRNEDDMWKADTQYMCTNEDKEFIRMVLNKWVDEIEVERMTREEAIKRLDEQAFKELEKGHWVEDIINGKALISCSECLHVISNYEGCFHYCPYCGKELKGVIRDEENKI